MLARTALREHVVPALHAARIPGTVADAVISVSFPPGDKIELDEPESFKKFPLTVCLLVQTHETSLAPTNENRVEHGHVFAVIPAKSVSRVKLIRMKLPLSPNEADASDGAGRGALPEIN